MGSEETEGDLLGGKGKAGLLGRWSIVIGYYWLVASSRHSLH